MFSANFVGDVPHQCCRWQVETKDEMFRNVSETCSPLSPAVSGQENFRSNIHCANPPYSVDQAVLPTPLTPLTAGDQAAMQIGGKGRGGGLVYRTLCVRRTMTERSLASGDEAEGRLDTVRDEMEVGGGSNVYSLSRVRSTAECA